ncbi:hypothetical protein GH714_037322 [Hevea brasiliensis]|uniref:Disease resistance protein At4g27190-like leucine-rich repeats domain-containing protein n=1 Tax=Hevea brasiliensis TaxID=3981 RepID=A0A6A6LYB7_HEVBR|nr:hypothetical protein GH714_037322 [Hevea brasiliensis]
MAYHFRLPSNAKPNYLRLSGKDITISQLDCFKPLPPRTNYLHLESFEDLRNIIPCLLVDGDCLKTLQISNCHNFNYLINVEELTVLEGTKHMWKSPSELLRLHNLQILKIYFWEELKVIFPASIAQGLEQLKQLELRSCDELEAIVAERQEREETIDNVVFSQLIKISLHRLPNLKAFCMDNLPFKWPSLEMVEVSNCPKMKTFAASDGNQSTPKLKVIKVNYHDIMVDGTDLDTVMQNHYKEEGVAGPSN